MSQSLSKLLVHLIVSTKDRYPFLNKSIRSELYPYINSILVAMDLPAVKIGGTEDHLHILFILSKNISISEISEEFKKRSSKWIKTKSPDFTQFFWQGGYAAFSVSRSDMTRVIEYIDSQEEHHTAVSFQDELRAFLQKYEVEYSEEYIWK